MKLNVVYRSSRDVNINGRLRRFGASLLNVIEQTVAGIIDEFLIQPGVEPFRGSPLYCCSRSLKIRVKNRTELTHFVSQNCI